MQPVNSDHCYRQLSVDRGCISIAQINYFDPNLPVYSQGLPEISVYISTVKRVILKDRFTVTTFVYLVYMYFKWALIT